MSDSSFFILFQTISFLQIFCKYSILQNKYLAYKESIENSRLNYASSKRTDQCWDQSVFDIFIVGISSSSLIFFIKRKKWVKWEDCFIKGVLRTFIITNLFKYYLQSFSERLVCVWYVCVYVYVYVYAFSLFIYTLVT